MIELLDKLAGLISACSWEVTVVLIIAVFIGVTGAFVSDFREDFLRYSKAPRLQIINRTLTIAAVILSFFAYIPWNESHMTDLLVTLLIFFGTWFVVFLVLRILIGTIRWVLSSW